MPQGQAKAIAWDENGKPIRWAEVSQDTTTTPLPTAQSNSTVTGAIFNTPQPLLGGATLATVGDYIRKAPGLAYRNLPAVGGAIGGAVGGVGGTAFGLGVGGVPGAAGGAALGGATGEALHQLGERYIFSREDPGTDTALGRATKIGTEGAIQGALTAGGGLAAKGAGVVGERLMQSAVKPAYRMVEAAVKKGEMPRVIKTLLDEGVNVTQGGIAKIQGLLTKTNDEIKDLIANSHGSVFPEQVSGTVDDVSKAFGRQAAPMDDLSQIAKVKNEFETVHGGAPIFPMKPLTVTEAQELKQGTYKAIGARNYGEQRGARVEAEKAIARGLKEGIQTAVPQVAAKNAREGALIEARDAIARRVAASNNRDLAGLAWVSQNPQAFVAFLMDRSPAVKSMLARGLYQSAARAGRVPENLVRAAMAVLAESKEPE